MATAAAAIIGRLRREVDQLFFDNEAFSPDRAVEFEPRAPIQQRYLEQLIAEGVVREAGSGRYWLDLHIYEELRRQRFIWTMRVLGAATIIFLVIVAVQAVQHIR
ncbi:hypothetical protein [Sphingomonas sp.]|uniref:hypothetical protein n=1 Tax=Sphingomonas sp. TaxID=28214 RepID=UPI0038A602D5